jgi:hypothetical protein
MTDQMHLTRFLTSLAAISALGIVLLIAFVALVDPYRLHRLVDIEGFNRVKPNPDHYQEEIKVAAARAMRPKVLLMGNSRMEIGFDPDSAVLGAARPAFNVAVPGTSVSVAKRQFDALSSTGSAPTQLVVGVEFLDFLLDPVVREAPAKPVSRLASHQWKVDTVFSIDAMFDAVQTLRIQHAPEARTLSAHGFNPLREYQRFMREDGQFAVFRQRAQENGRTMLAKPHGLINSHSGSSTDWDGLRTLIDHAAARGAAVDLVIYPYHAQIMATFEQAGLWPVFEQWKAMLVAEVDAARAHHPGAQLRLWDFSGYGPLQCERIPAQGETGQATWYWEAGHFKAALGEVMLTRMFGSAPAAQAPAGFGVALEDGNLEENRQRIARERMQCAQAAPTVFADVAAMMQTLERTRQAR